MSLPDEATAAGINIILGAAEGEIVADAEVKKNSHRKRSKESILKQRN